MMVISASAMMRINFAHHRGTSFGYLDQDNIGLATLDNIVSDMIYIASNHGTSRKRCFIFTHSLQQQPLGYAKYVVPYIVPYLMIDWKVYADCVD